MPAMGKGRCRMMRRRPIPTRRHPHLRAPMSSARKRGRVAVREGTRFGSWARDARVAGALPNDRMVQVRAESPRIGNGEEGPS